MSSRCKIKDVADRSGFTAATLRYYEEIGLLPEAMTSDLRRAAATLETHRPECLCDANCGCVTNTTEPANPQLVRSSR